MQKSLYCFILSLFSMASFGDSDQAIRDKILKNYGSKAQYDTVINEQNESRTHAQIKNYQQRLKEPLVQNQKKFDRLNSLEQENYLNRRRAENEMMSRFILKHHILLENEKNNALRAKEKKESLAIKEAIEDTPTEVTDLGEMIQNIGENSDALKDFKLNKDLFKSFFNDKSKRSALKMIKDNPLAAMPTSELQHLVLEKTEGSALNKILKGNPKVLNTMVQLLKDKEAMPALASLINHPDRLKKYGIACFVIVILGFLFNLKYSNGSMIKKIFLKMGISLGMIFLNLGLFYYLFMEELSPALRVIKTYYFN